MANVVVDVLLAVGVVLELVCCVALLVVRDSYDRLHFVSAATTVPAFCILAAVLVREHVSAGGLQAIVAVSLMFLLNPILVTATARAIRRVEESAR